MLRFDAATFELGLSRVEAAPGSGCAATTWPGTVVDLMRLLGRFGAPLAHAAVQRYLRRRDARPARVLELVSTLDVYGLVRRALDVAIAQ